MHEYRFTAPLWRWKPNAAWHFVTVPFDIADEIEEITHGRTGGFGSVKVTVTIGTSAWSTSLFPDKSSESYVLPLKAEVRKREGLEEGSVAEVAIRLAI